MNKITLLSFTLLLLVTACASPAKEMSAQEVSMLSDKQLCDLHTTYLWEKKTEIEIGRRNLNCDPANLECIERGMRPNTPELAVCVTQLHEKAELERRLKEQQEEIERQRTENEKLLNKNR